MTLMQYQQRVLAHNWQVNYGAVTQQTYPSSAMKQEPFVGFKILLRDPFAPPANTMEAQQRDQAINMYLAGMLRGSGCILRQTEGRIMPDGYWLIAMPRPRSHATRSLDDLLRLMETFERTFGFIRQGMIEVSVSGRCWVGQEPQAMSTLVIPERYTQHLITPANVPYKWGGTTRLNDEYMVLKTRWNLPVAPQQLYEDMLILAQLISSIYR